MDVKRNIEELKNIAETDDINFFIEKLNEILHYLSNIGDSSYNKRLIQLFENHIKSHFHLEYEASSYSIFEKNIGNKVKQLISASLILLLEKSTHLFTDEKLGLETLRYFERNYSQSKWLKLNAGYERLTQFEKILYLQEQIRNNFDYIKSDLDTVYEIENLKKFQNHINKILNSEFFKIGLKPFIGQSSLEKSVINKVFIAISKYVNSALVEKHEAYTIAVQRINNQISTFSVYDFPNTIMLKPFKEVLKLLVEDYKKSPYSKPASLFVNPIRKKFLIGQDNKVHSVPIVIAKNAECIAKQVLVEFNTNDENIKINQNKFAFSNFTTESIEFNLEVHQYKPSKNILLKANLLWENVNDTLSEKDFDLMLNPQRTDINWEDIKNRDPYNFEPVVKEELLIGRTGIIRKIYPKLIGDRISSFFLLGQKRVGKTSIAKTILNKLRKEDNNAILIYKETGEFQNGNSPKDTINELGEIICESIKMANIKYLDVPNPKFEGSLNRLSGFIDKIHIIDSTQKIVIVLDEFDEIYPELYLKGPLGDSFFLSLRALSNKGLVSFILVGGEKMRIILDSQGSQINKFGSISVDYFEESTLYTDYSALIKSPVPEFEFEDNAIELLYKYTAGNPYFTKIICDKIFNYCISENDCHITKGETHKAIKEAMTEAQQNSFMHFWSDGIKGKKEKKEIITMERKKFLLAYAKTKQNFIKVSKSSLLDFAQNRGLTQIVSERVLDEFIDRNIIYEYNNNYKILVKYFEKWLVGFGIDQILTSFSDDDRIDQYKMEEEEARVKTDEIQILLLNWGLYKGSKISVEVFRQWLEQFDDCFDQRNAFKLAQNIKFYESIEIDTKLASLYRRITKNIRAIVGSKIIYAGDKTGKQLMRIKKRNLLVSYLDGVGKSGSYYAKKFADRNNIASDLVVANNEIFSYINNPTNSIEAIIFIDDFIGTGDSMIKNISSFLQNNKESLKAHPNLSIHVAAIVGYNDSKFRIEEALAMYHDKIYFYTEDILNDEDKIFSDKSKLFSSFAEKERIKIVANSYGSRINSYHPLGYGNCQSLIVFPETCPNNTLPIFWKQASNWTPLFKRDTN